MLGFEPLSSASEPCCPTHCAMGTIGISDKRQWNHKSILHDRFEPEPTAWEYFVLT